MYNVCLPISVNKLFLSCVEHKISKQIEPENAVIKNRIGFLNVIEKKPSVISYRGIITIFVITKASPVPMQIANFILSNKDINYSYSAIVFWHQNTCQNHGHHKRNALRDKAFRKFPDHTRRHLPF